MSVCCRKRIKATWISSLFRFHKVWATWAYLDMVNFFSTAVMISAPDGLFKVINKSVLHRPNSKTIHLLVSEIVVWGTMPYSVRRWIPSKWKRRRLARSIVTRRLREVEFPSSSVSSNSTSYCLLNHWIMISKTKVSSNRSQQRKAKQSSTKLHTFQIVWR